MGVRQRSKHELVAALQTRYGRADRASAIGHGVIVSGDRWVLLARHEEVLCNLESRVSRDSPGHRVLIQLTVAQPESKLRVWWTVVPRITRALTAALLRPLANVNSVYA